MDKLEVLLDLYPLDELFDVLDITPQEVLEHLFKAGLIQIPPFLEDMEDGLYQE